ncbi:phage tail length tape measure family protein [Pseudomonas sp. AN-1]|uniref:phage tail length tape measure family protein n=1 Tax=Pseudomonas sp. AN-1 TaxID=3096605 RepID=UPI002A6AD682|nr:phage tail length tape measure family protein [Pseudomonas sp. AN-1]WPP47088.1 phage tail length tape measure family protein [Pseudomonas sp. AN-1]
MADPNMTLALRIQADFKQAEQAMGGLGQQLDQTGQQAQQTNTQLGATSAAVDKLGAESAAATAAVKGVAAASASSAAGLAQQAAIMQRAGLTAGQYNQAMRMLPMQLTDVATSLASGMPLWMVAIQQGGQIRDSFGGIGNAARAVASAISPMAAAVSLGVAALAGLGWAWFEGSQEAVRFNEALILTGSYARMTSGDLAGLAQQMDGMTGVTQRSASAALTQVVATGKFAGEQVELVAVAAEQMRVATGKAIEDTIAEFVKLGGDPVKAILDLNDQYHFLSRSQLEQIRSLQEQGRHQEAATEAMRTYAGVIAERTPQVEQNLGSIERSWRRIKQLAGEAVDAVAGIGRPGPLAEQIAEVEAELARNRNLKFRSFDDDYKANELEQRLAYLRKQLDQERQAAERVKAGGGTVDSGEERARKQAQEQFDRLALSNLDKKAKLEREIADIRELGLKAGKSEAEIEAQIAAARARYEESLPKARKPRERAYTDDAATRMLQQLRNQEASLRSQLTANDKLSAAQRAQAEWAQQLADLKGKAILTAEQKSLLANQDAITAQLAQNAALDEQIRKLAEINQLTQRSAQINQSMAAALEGQRAQNQRELDGYGLGQRERERIASERDIRAEYQRYQDELNEATPKDLLGSSEYLDASAEIQRGLTAALDENVAAYDRLIQKQGDWSAGASEAFANYMTEAQDIAGQTEQMVGGALDSLTQGIGDSFAQAIVYGDDLRASLQGVAQTILAEVISALVQMGVRYAINAAMGQATAAAVTAAGAAMAAATAAAWAPAAAAVSLATMGANSAPAIAGMTAAQTAASGFALAPGFSTGGHVTGPGTGTSDSIPAWLSNDEFVTRSAVVRQPGALPFLEDFNRRGMSALDDWAAAVRHSTGGLAGVPAPALPAPSLGNVQLAEPAKALSATVNLKQRVTPVLSASTVADLMNTPAGEEVLLVHISKDPAKYRSALGL